MNAARRRLPNAPCNLKKKSFIGVSNWSKLFQNPQGYNESLFLLTSYVVLDYVRL